MKTLKKVPITPVYVDTIPEELEEGKIYISKMYHTSVHNCLCGCGEKTVLPLNDDKDRNGWYLTENEKGVSFSPSVGNYSFPCKSHYIITNNIANFV